jgi:hypothetical protein
MGLHVVFRHRFCLQMIVGLGLSNVVLAGTALENRVPVQALLIRSLEAGRDKTGDSILAKVSFQWQTPDCVLRQGAILKGRIVAAWARSKNLKTSEIALLFESGECGGKEMKLLPLTVAALIAPDRSVDSDLEHQALGDAVGLGISGGLRSVEAAAATVQFEPPRYKPPKAVMPGQVIGIPDIKLSVGSGEYGSSILASSRRSVRLESGSQLVLVPNLNAEATTALPPADRSAAAPTGEARTSEDTVAGNEVEVCPPSECSSTLTPGQPEAGTASATATVAIRELGYRLRAEAQELTRFDHDAALAYLGPRTLLFTFNPHQLVPRTGAEAGSRQLHAVRGVLFDLQSLKVERTVEWRVPDAGQYLWTVGPDKVLLHVGRELHFCGSELKVEQKLSLSGPLAFVEASPSGTYFAVGVAHERHSEAIHRQLLESGEREPEEDVEVRVLDVNFKTLATFLRSSWDTPPTLSDEGEIRIVATGKTRWAISQNSWDGQHRVLAQVNSQCRPTLKTLPSNLFFILGCDRQADDKWYRVLRVDGRPMLKGSSSSAELEQTVIATSGALAIRIATATKPLAGNATYRSSDLEAEHIAVYRANDGRKVLAVGMPSPIPTLQTFALSPRGDQLAVLSQDQIAVYALPAEP